MMRIATSRCEVGAKQHSSSHERNSRGAFRWAAAGREVGAMVAEEDEEEEGARKSLIAEQPPSLL